MDASVRSEHYGELLIAVRAGRGLAALASSVILVSVAPCALANVPGMYGFGSRSTAMGGSVSADVGDVSANYYNPAGLVRPRAVQLEAGYLHATHALESNGLDNGVDPARGFIGGLVAPGTLFRLPFAFGLATHIPDDRLSRARSLPQSQPRWELYENRVQLVFVAAHLAIAPRPWLRIGAGLAFVSSTRGRLDIAGDVALPNASDSRLTHQVDADLSTVRYPQAGVQIDVAPWLTLSAVYRGSFRLALEIDANIDGTVVIGRPSDPGATRIPGHFAISSRSTSVFLPQQAVLGAAFRPREDLTVTADLTWIDWSAYQNPAAQLHVGLDLTIPPDLGTFSTPATPMPTIVVPANFRDTIVPRIGVEWRRSIRAHRLSVRGGYRFDASPVRDQSGATNFLDSHRHGLSTGVGFVYRGIPSVLTGGLSLDVHADLQLLERREIRKDSAIDPVGDTVIGGHVLNVGVTAGVLF